MKPAPFEYHRPADATEAVTMLAALGDEAKILGGGQSLLPIMNMRLAEPGHLIDVSALADLLKYDDEPDHVTWGAATTHQMVEDELVPDPCSGLLQAAGSGIGYRAIRCRGTVGGSLAHADSSAEWPTVLTAVNATVVATSVRGERRLPLREFFHGFFSTSMDGDELITRVEIPRFDPAVHWGLVKTNRKAGEFAESLGVATWRLDPNGAYLSPDIWLGAARDVPVNLVNVQNHVTGLRQDQTAVSDIREALQADLESGWADLDSAERHRVQLHAVTVHRALTSTNASEDR